MHISFSRWKRSVIWAGRGIKFAFSIQSNFFLMVLIALVVIAAGFIVRLSLEEWIIILLLIGFVLSLEMFNTAIERMLDFLEPHFSPPIGKIKDILAGGVLIASIIAAILGLLIFIPKLFP